MLKPGEQDYKTIRAFNKLWHESINGTWHLMRWLGVKVLKTPCDLFMYQELIHKIKPGLIVETGTCFGGSALYLATICEAIGHGQVLTIDIRPPSRPPQHPRLSYYCGDSTSEHTAAYVRKLAAKTEGNVLVILDSLHTKQHVARELALYSPLVKKGSYVIVEDTDLNRFTRFDHGPGPYDAVREFVAGNYRFDIDKDCERYYLTFNPDGYLKCVH